MQKRHPERDPDPPTPGKNVPPRVACWLLERLLPPSYGEYLLGDLCEEFADLAGHKGRLQACAWYWRETARALLRRAPRSQRPIAALDQPALARGGRARSSQLMQTIFQDLVYSLRLMRRWPAVTCLALLTMALGIGANTAIFSLVDSVLLRPLAYPDAERLYSLRLESAKVGNGPISAADFLALQEAGSFQFSAYSSSAYTLTADDLVERIVGANVDSGFLRTLGIGLSKGRSFTPEQNQPGRNQVALLSHALWQNRLGGDPGAIGNSVRLDGKDYQVLGVLPESFRFPGHFQADVLVPFALETPRRRGPFFLNGLVRLKADANPAAMQAELEAVSRSMDQAYSDITGAQRRYDVQPLRERLMGHTRSTLLLLWGAVGLVLLIACVNVANLLLGRAASRGREMAVRASLGAGRKRLFRQLMTESLLLSLAGGLLGTALAFFLLQVLPSQQMLQGFPATLQPSIDWRVLFFTLAAAGACGLGFGTAPAAFLLKRDVASGLNQAGRGSSQSAVKISLRSWLVVAEFALALMLLIGAGLLIKSFLFLQDVNVGFPAQNLLTARISLPGGGSGLFANDATPEAGEQRRLMLRQLARRVAALPGVESVGLASGLPPSGYWFSNDFVLREHPLPSDEAAPSEIVNVVDPDYFATLQAPLVEGRFFQAADTPESRPVAVVDEAFVQRYMPDGSAVGKHIRWAGASAEAPWAEIVGVVGNIRYEGLEEDFRPTWYMPLTAFSPPPTFAYLVARTSLPAATLTGQVREELKQVNPEIPLTSVQTMEERVASSLATQRFRSMLMLTFAAAALLLAAVGIYGVISYSVAQRSKEMGIRMALGAARGDVFRQILGGGLRLMLMGLALGLAASWTLSSLLSEMLFRVRSFDPATVAAVSLTLLSVAVAATLIPTLKATRVDPVRALREE